MQTLEARYKIVTPMFIGGAQASDDPEIRPPSIKGALRFWWRALHWGYYLQQHQSAPSALKALYQHEAALFGTAASEQLSGQGLCLLKIKDVNTEGIEKKWPKNNDAGAGYLGYGLDVTQSGDPHRKAIDKGHFTLSLRLKKEINPQQIQQLRDTLLAFGLLGGLGSRARRGFGSLAIQQLDEECFEFKNAEGYFDTLKDLLARLTLAPAMPIYTAFNTAMIIATVGQGQDPRRLMDRLDGQYREARKQAGKGLAKLPFGLPLAGNKGQSDIENRRSSPLFMHIHPIGSEFVAMLTLIPAQFHPDYPKGNQADFYRPIQTFLNTLERVYP